MTVRDLIPRIRSRAPVLRRESSSPLAAFQEEVNRLFEDFWRDFDGVGSSLPYSFAYPRIEVSETEREVKVEAEIPGMDEKDVEVLLQDGTLILRGERRGESEDSSRRMSERYYGRFERRIALPVEVEADKVGATYAKGVLTVTLPKSQRAIEKVKRITISSK